jgi:cbb3-type cytochrome oxidase maturation protein
MEVMWIVLPLALLIATAAVITFTWAVRTGQFDDLVTPAMRVVTDDDDPAVNGPALPAGGIPPASREDSAAIARKAS